MIFNTTLNHVNESELDELLENTEDRFEYETMAEACAIVIGEQEKNWTEFMKGIGLSELATVNEGQEVIYEGTRLEKFIEKAKAYFKMALSKLAEITRSFIAKIDQFIKPNDAFIKKYSSKLKNAKIPSNFDFKGYEFSKELDSTPIYNMAAPKSVTNADYIVKDGYSKEKAEDTLVGPSGAKDGSLSERLILTYFGSKDKVSINNPNIDEQLNIIKNTKDLKKKATDSYKSAASKIKQILKDLKKAEKEFLKASTDRKDSLASAGKTEQAYTILINYWKTFSTGALTKHSIILRALGSRNRQAKAICTKIIISVYKNEGKDKRKKLKAKTESYVDTDAFLDAIDFI